jgi:D-serine deaminase-like pyridoxal phosphate-dependent protein
VAVDSKEAVDALAAAGTNAGSTIGILVDLDVGFHRTGLQTPAEALNLAKHAAKAKGVRLDGLFCYPGHVWLPADQQPAALSTVEALLTETLDLWTKAGMEAEIVTGGSTPTAYQSHHVAPLTDIRPGTYVYNDMNTVYGGYCALDDCAARIACTVVSNAVPGKVVLDAGSKTLTTDRNFPQPDSGHGYVVEYPGAKIVRLSEEHGEVDLSACERKPKLGERVHVIPNHICPCVNLQDAAWLIHDDGSPEALRIDARGLLS